jgi:YVTN family beta-propeller protein
VVEAVSTRPSTEGVARTAHGGRDSHAVQCVGNVSRWVTKLKTGIADGKRLWVLNFGDYTVQSIDPATSKAGAPIPVGKEPYVLIFDGTRLWVANRWDHTVQAIDPNTNETYAPIAINDAPWALAADGNRLWVAISDSNAVQYIQIGE